MNIVINLGILENNMRISKLFLFSLILTYAPKGFAATNDDLNVYYRSIFPGEAFIATPYGADSRFRPKTVWLYLDNFHGATDKQRKQGAWIAASSGEAIYDPVFAPIHTDAISLPVSAMDYKIKFGLTASLAGTVDAVDINAGIEMAKANGVEINIDPGTTEIEYVYYLDMLIAQDQNTNALGAFNATMERRFKRKIPKRRVITAALRTKNSTITVTNAKNLNLDANAELRAFLSKIGFTFNKEKNTFDKLSFSDWRYIAYQSLYTDAEGQVSSDGQTPYVEITAENLAPFQENAFGRTYLQAGPEG